MSPRKSSSRRSSRGRSIHITCDGEVKVHTHILLNAEVRRRVEELARRRNRSLSDVIENALKLYLLLHDILGREPTSDEVVQIVNGFVMYREVMKQTLQKLPTPRVESEAEARVVQTLYANYLFTGDPSVIIRNDYDLMETFDMPPEQAKNTILKLRNKGIIYMVELGGGAWKIGLRKEYIEKHLTTETMRTGIM